MVKLDHSLNNGKMKNTQWCKRGEHDVPQEGWHPGKWGKAGTYCRDCFREHKREWRIKQGIKPHRHRDCTHPNTRIDRKRCEGWEPKPRTYSIEYRAVHRRIRDTRGKATEYYCYHCDGDAQEWAYDHKDPNPVHGIGGRHKRMVEYSADVNHYIPLCKPCHVRFDDPVRFSGARRTP